MASGIHNTDAVMLIGFGGPDNPGEIRPFLDRVVAGRPVPRERYENVVHHYERIGGRSPYNELTKRQAVALRDHLRREGHDLPVVIGMRNTAPFFLDALAELSKAGVRRVVGFVLSAFRCEASWGRYIGEVEAARVRLGPDAPEIIYPPAWHDDARFIAAVARRIREALSRLAPNDRARAELIFTAHSIPLKMAEGAPYVSQIESASRLTAAAAGISNWRIAWQSRSGSPREPWLEPSVNDVLPTMTNPVVVVPIGFLSDHVEVLYDLDIEACDIAEKAGIRIERAATVGDAVEFIAMVADLAVASLK
jgi:protoporphyrin/coproporphyrin ferrochelatase